jgi:hypothetical protein
MTKGRAVLPGTVVAGQKPFFITLGGPKAYDFPGRDDKGEGGCGPDLMFTEGLHLGDEKRLLFSSYCSWKYRLPFVISTGAPKERSGEICGCPFPNGSPVFCKIR